MHRFLLDHKIKIVLGMTLLAVVFLRFYNLNWGAPFYFHPDERNIASSISQMSLPNNLNPKFFAYGSLPLYATFFLGLIPAYFSTCDLTFPCSITFEQAIIWTRIISAIFAVLLIPLTFFLAEKLKKGLGFSASLLTTFSTGYIQFAHFGTVEMWLTFFTLLLFLPLLKILSKPSVKLSILSGLILGILLSTKISSVPLFLLPFLALLLSVKSSFLKKIIRTAIHMLVILSTAGIIFILTNPFVFLDTTSFLSSMRYESGVALGTLPVFYTGEFFQSIPILFQFTSIYPFLLNPFVTIFFIAAFFHLLLKIRNNKSLILLFSFFLLTFLSQSFVFAKWTRYMLPTLPFVYLIVSYWVDQFPKKKNYLLGFLIFTSIIFSLSYFVTVFVEKDTRIQAFEFTQKTIPSTAPILSEVYDLGIIPFNERFPLITLYNFYDLDNNSIEFNQETLRNALDHADYIILPSQRLVKIRLLQPSQFPQGHAFYKELFSSQLGFEKIYETPCSIWCQIIYLGSPVMMYEETASVFDRPSVFIFKKQ